MTYEINQILNLVRYFNFVAWGINFVWYLFFCLVEIEISTLIKYKLIKS